MPNIYLFSGASRSHGVGFSGPSLSVGQDGGVGTGQELPDHRLHGLEVDGGLGGVRVEDVVKFVALVQVTDVELKKQKQKTVN